MERDGPQDLRLFRLGSGGELTLVGGWSPSSGLAHFPRSPVCPYTGADDVEEIDLPRHGRLWAWTAVRAAPPGYHGPVPYGVGVVEVEGGLRVVGRLTEADPDVLTFGQPMVVVAQELPWEGGAAGAEDDGALDVGAVADGGGTFVTWAFAPEGG